MVASVLSAVYHALPFWLQRPEDRPVDVFESADGAGRAPELAAYGAAMESRVGGSLLQQLHTGMAPIHFEAMNNLFLRNLIARNEETEFMTCSKEYVVYLCNLFCLHQALEKAQARLLKEEKGQFVFPALYRSGRILRDIKLWSIHNPTAGVFSDAEIDDDFIAKVKYYCLPSVATFIAKLEAMENPLLAIGEIFALYGTVLSGGQEVMKGVKKAFVERLNQALDDSRLSPDEKAKLRLKEYHSALKDEILKKVKESPDAIAAYAADSVALFCFDDPHFNIAAFKTKWHAALDALSLSDEEKKAIIEQCVATIRVVLDMIKELQERLPILEGKEI